MPELKWKIWYSDGSTFSNLSGSAGIAPAYKVQCVVQLEESWGKIKPMLMSSGEWYIYDLDEDYWYRSDDFGMHCRLLERPFKLAVKAGEFIPTAEHERVKDLAREDARTWLNGT